ncbi:phage major capsid protein [Paraburkholderia sp. BR13444]|uniref:phage major capsid protein n=1 Tax=Paraburkholderia sp. BR13444 TaxID=3236997 RepID=UPI0034CDAF7E
MGDFLKVVRLLAASRDDNVSNLKLRARQALSIRSDAGAREFFERATKITATGSLVTSDDDAVTVSDPEVVRLVARRSVLGLVASAVPGGWRNVIPFKAIATQVAGAVASWVAEAALKPISGAEFAISPMEVRKVTATLVVSAELLKIGSDQIDAALQRDLVRAVTDELNATFASNDAPSATSPGGALYGTAPLPSTGSLTADAAMLINAFAGDLSRAFWLFSPKMAVALVDEFGIESTLGAAGGFLLGLPAIVVNGAPDGMIALVDASRIAVYDGPIVPAMATHATMTLDDNGSQTLLSLWQSNCAALRSELFCYWKPLADTCVWVDDAPMLGAEAPTRAAPAATTPAVLQKQTKTKGETA